MFGFGFSELFVILILLICFVHPKDYKTLLIQFKKLKLALESLYQDFQNQIMLLDEEIEGDTSSTKNTDSTKKT